MNLLEICGQTIAQNTYIFVADFVVYVLCFIRHSSFGVAIIIGSFANVKLTFFHIENICSINAFNFHRKIHRSK